MKRLPIDPWVRGERKEVVKNDPLAGFIRQAAKLSASEALALGKERLVDFDREFANMHSGDPVADLDAIVEQREADIA